MATNETYLSFLQLLDDSQLITHINSVSQDATSHSLLASKQASKQASRSASLIDTSTPCKPGRTESIVRSFRSDPFDDDLDSELMKMVVKQYSITSLEGGVPCNQLAMDEGDDTSADESDERENDLDKKETARNTGDVHEDRASDTKLNFGVEAGHMEIGDVDHREIGDADRVENAHGNVENVGDAGQHESDDEDENHDTTFGEVGQLHKFGDYGTYAQNKFKKQQLADQEYVEWDRKRRQALGDTSEPSKVFEGCMVFVNGNTVPTLAVIHKLVILHGGRFLNYLHNKGAATHIVCDRLTPRKRIEFRNYKVVKAQWVVDCVEQGKLLDWKQYRLIDEVDYDQQRLGFEALDQNVDESSDELLDEHELLLEDQDIEVTDEVAASQPSVADETRDTAQPEALSTDKAENASAAPAILQLKVAGGMRQHRAMDAKHPDFLKHFFANSRLHHLSTWKADLRSKFLRLVAAKVPRGKSVSQETEKVILHIDFDCFFATASTLSHPALDLHRDPIAVSHGGKSSDIASCNYVARKFGVSNGMWLGRAMKLCPNLKIVDYDFNTYEKCSNAFYSYLISKSFDSILPVLIDEVLVDATSACQVEGQISESAVSNLCEEIRKDIYNLTRCSISIGASKNVLLAKLAIRTVKPDGFVYLNSDYDSFLDKTKVRDIPGIGRSLTSRLGDELQLPPDREILISDVKSLTLTRLSNIFGEKTGLKLYENCRGIDRTEIALDLSTSESLLGRKSVSVDINFGIRFDNHAQAETFLMSLAKELHSRLIDLGVCGSALTLKLAKRAPGAPINPPKFLGMGHCDFFSKSSRLGVPTNDWGIMGSEMKSLFRILNVPAPDLRGIAVSMTKLQDISVLKKQGQQMLKFNRPRQAKKVAPVNSQTIPYAEAVHNSDSIDWEVFNQLPEDIRREFKHELLRRGIPVSGKERSPAKTSPTKSDSNGRKVYIQQLFPTQLNGPFKHTRVVESPKKKRKLQVSPQKSPLPIKREQSPTPFNDSVSYDEHVLNEIPSSIRNEFYQDLEWHKKNKRLVFIPTKQKISKRQEIRQLIEEREITLDWVAEQSVISTVGSFAGLTKFSDLRDQVIEWIRLSIDTHGPHPDDFQIFFDYIKDLSEKKNLTRAVGLLKVIESELHNQRTSALLCKHSSQEAALISAGIDDWQKHYDAMEKMVIAISSKFGITVDM